jgi:hypothetical protein
MFPLGRLKTSKEEFRAKFQRSLRACVRRGFSIEESFGMIWVETWDEFSLSERDESELYDELMQWAKTGQLTDIPTVIHRNYSQKIGPVSANLR